MEAAAGGVEAEGVMRVLVVDDSPVDRRVAQLLLSSDSCAGSFHVIAVDSARKAMEFLGLKDGGEALNPLEPIPVVVMSSEDEPQRISRRGQKPWPVCTDGVTFIHSSTRPVCTDGLVILRSRCLSAGAEDFIVKPLQSKDVQRLRNCSAAARPSKGAAPCEAAVVAKRNQKPPHPAGAASPSGRRASLAGVAMVLHSSGVEYLPLLLKLVVLAYAALCLGELLHRWASSDGRCSLSPWCA
ncbi:Two-component response regulator ARR16 [Zea mays]|uniref:Two-component response regulator ARR16 n=1 Tax=Zea mays TaxID=4577 RepID=A0A1D6J7C3_MAIZE|nr:Two-component response regulator ARR16 [Zea mays]